MIIHNRGLGRSFDPVQNVVAPSQISEVVLHVEEKLEHNNLDSEQARKNEISRKRAENLAKARAVRAANREKEDV